MARLPRSPYATPDPQRHQRVLDERASAEVWEFYRPFAEVTGVVELVRVLNPDYGAVDLAVVVPPRPTDIYVNSEVGDRYLRERFPHIRRHRLDASAFRLWSEAEGQVIRAQLRADEGVLRWLNILIKPRPGRPWETERYESDRVWGGPWTCHGVDLRVPACAEGSFQREEGTMEPLDGDAILYLGSFGRILPAKRNAPPAP